MAGPTSTTPKLWLKADAIVGKSDGNTVAAADWPDSSGSGNGPTAATGGVYKTNQINGLPVVRFASASSQYYQHGYTGEPNTVVVVCKSTGTSWRTVAGGKSSSTTVNNLDAYYLSPNTGGDTWCQFSRTVAGDNTGVPGQLATWAGRDVTGPHNRFCMMGGRINGSVLELFHDGMRVGRTTNANAKTDVTAATVGCGWFNDAKVDYFDGDVAEVLIYDVALSDAELAQVFAYLAAKYALAAYAIDYVLTRAFLMATWGNYPGAANANTGENLQLMGSDDGLTWYGYRPDYLYPSSGNYCRDATIRNANGTLWLAHTNQTYSDANYAKAAVTFRVSKSTDGGLSFTTVKDVTGGPAGSISWAPEWVDDTTLFFSLNSGGTGNFVTSYVSSSDNWATASAVGTVGGSALPSGVDVIDSYRVYAGGSYYLWLKYGNGATHYIQVYKSASPLSGYDTLLWSGNWAGWGVNQEGPSVLQIGGVWYVWFDDDSTFVHYVSHQTAGDWTGGVSSTWSAKSTLTAPFNMRHGTVVYAASAVAFSGTPLAGTRPLAVAFTDASTQSPNTWHWEKSRDGGATWADFAGSPTAQNPTEAFAAGVWGVRLTVTNAGGTTSLTRAAYVASRSALALLGVG